ncbi:hypothetical protein VFPPC_17728 [Pochonia chlamydosporia 170]|uniref:Uncharacterized protein n=1 Tax=Pochonia chlamydosporia 170 TaxID=1380566 RepID=A0A219AQN6_METCM|nr:hypothetical protein VFPPC_17728 [Pochonia chlamydosporia 170]OWT43096.1 hypothetical protein VFPPC_17728 [Pochonia chlamydosporia 170]
MPAPSRPVTAEETGLTQITGPQCPKALFVVIIKAKVHVNSSPPLIYSVSFCQFGRRFELPTICQPRSQTHTRSCCVVRHGDEPKQQTSVD